MILQDPFFRSQTKRSASFIAPSDVPGPGEYHVDRGVATVKEACGTGLGGVGGRGGQGVSAGRPGNQRGGHSREEEESSPGEVCLIKSRWFVENFSLPTQCFVE